MCGITGFITSKDNSRNPEVRKELHRIMTRLLLASQVRGHDATGVAQLNEYGDMMYAKQGITATEFVKKPVWKAWKTSNILTGHTRSGTQGDAKDNRNNHPIFSKASRLCLCHNGVISNDDSLKTEFKLKCDGKVDSEVILRLIEKKMNGKNNGNIVKAIKGAMKEIRGSATFSVIGEDYPHLLFLVKSNNPLCIAYIKELDTIFYASTQEILSVGFERVKYLFNFIAIRERMYDAIYQDLDDDTVVVIEKKDGEEFRIKQEGFEKKKYYYFSSKSTYGKQARFDWGEDELSPFEGKNPEVGDVWNPETGMWETPRDRICG